MKPNYSISHYLNLIECPSFIVCCNYAPINEVCFYGFAYESSININEYTVAIFKIKMKDIN